MAISVEPKLAVMARWTGRTPLPYPHDDTVLRGCDNPFQATGGLNVLEGHARPRRDQDLVNSR